jgi:HD-like signal output (HDOD) protein
MSTQRRFDAQHPLLGPHRAVEVRPADAQLVLDALQRDDASFTQIARVISTSPEVSELVVRLARAVAHGLPQRPMTVEHSVGVLGLQRLREALLPCTKGRKSAGASEAA